MDKENNGKILFNEEAEEITKINGLWNVKTKNNKFVSPILINAAGAWCDEVSILAGCKPLNLSPKRRTVIIIQETLLPDKYIAKRLKRIYNVKIKLFLTIGSLSVFRSNSIGNTAGIRLAAR